jgi:hypothetical protein
LGESDGGGMSLTDWIVLAGELGGLVGVVVPVIVSVNKVKNGMKCQLRSDMLNIYYHNREQKIIRQYEYENFVMLYECYKVLKGNSFIDKIYKEVQEWEIVT